MLKEIVKIDEYLAELDKIKQDVNIYITVGDLFFQGDNALDKNYQDYIKNISDTFRGWGFKFSGNQLDCFIGVLEAGQVSFDRSSDESVAYECEHHGLSLRLISKSYNYNGDMHIYVNGIDYAYFTTGVAFLILDKNSDTVIDAATFDTLFGSDAKRYSFEDQMALYEKYNTDGALDKYLSRSLIYVDGDNIPVFYDFIINNPHINREKLFSDKDRTVGELTFRLVKLLNPTIFTTHPMNYYKLNRIPFISCSTPNLVKVNLCEIIIDCAKSSDIAEKIYKEGNLSDKNRIGILFAFNTGDAYYTLAISKVYEKETGKKPVFIFRERNREVVNLFSAYAIEYVFLPDDEYFTLYRTSTVTGGQFGFSYNIFDYFHSGEYWKAVPEMGWFKGICSCLKIPYDESNKRLFIKPENQTCDREMYIKRDGIIPGKTVLLCPEAKSDGMISFTIWNVLQNMLEQKGFKCLIMSYSDSTQKSMKGPFVKIPYADAIDYVQVCGFVIAHRSGFVDVISSAKVSLTTLWINNTDSANLSVVDMGLRQESDGYFNNIYVDKQRIDEVRYDIEIIQNVLKFLG
jgi:hypothetical protein